MSACPQPVTLRLVESGYDSPAATELVARVQQEYVVRYGGPDDSPVDAAQFAPPHGVFLVGYLDGAPVATGGLRRRSADVVEIKRMYVVPDHRGRGLSRQMLAGLEAAAARLGARQIVLETGSRQPEAVSLYRSSGYLPTAAYGHYAESPLSMYFAKPVTAAADPRISP